MSDPTPLPPSEQLRRRRGGGGFSFALILITVGAVFLLLNLGIIGLNWQAVARYWPVLLILVGLDIIVGRRSMLGSIIMGVVTVGAVVGVVLLAQAAPTGQTSGTLVSGAIDQSFGNVKSLKITVDTSSAPLELHAGPDKSKVTGDYRVMSGTQPKVDYRVEGDTGVMTITQPPMKDIPFGFNFDLDEHITVNLPTGIPIELHTAGDLGKVNLDLTDLQITDLNVDGGSGQLTVTLPKSGTLGDVHIKGDLGQVIVAAPDGAKLDIASLTVESGSGALTVTLPAQGKLGDTRVDGDLGAVTVNVPDGAQLDIASYTVISGSGSLTAQLPAQGTVGDVKISGDLGSVTLEIPGGPHGLSVKSLNVKSGSGSLTVTLPDLGDYVATLNADMGAVNVSIPAALEAKMTINNDLGQIKVQNNRLKAAGDKVWESSGFSSASNRVTLSIKASSGSVTIQ
jgi:putative adhesin/cell wall-active antibiotic response 4TMS protein YvqF